MIDMSLDLLGYHPKYGIMLQCEPLFIGISQRVINVRPTAFFYVKCTISSPQVQEFYQCATDGFESTHLLAIPKVKDTKYLFLWCPSTKPNISLTNGFKSQIHCDSHT